MKKQEVAESTKQLAGFLCISLKEAWDHHTDESIKEEFSFDEIAECLREGRNEG